MTLHKQMTEINELFKKAGVENPEHQMLECSALRDSCTWWLRSPVDEQDARDLLAAHYERLWCELERCSVNFNGHMWRVVWHDRHGLPRTKGNTDKLTAILFALTAKYGERVSA